MNHLTLLSFILAALPQTSAAADSDWYVQKATSLKESQDRTESAINQFRIQQGLGGTRTSSQTKSNQEERPLFTVHDDLGLKIPAGKLLYGKTLNRLVVGSDGSPAILTLDDGQGRYSALRVLGTARQAGTQGRLSLELNRLLVRDGKTITIQGTALDQDGAFGLEAQVFSSKALAMGGAIASAFIAGAAASQQSQTTNAFGFYQQAPSGRNAILQGLAQSTSDQSKHLIDDATSEKPILVVEIDTPVTILIQEEARF